MSTLTDKLGMSKPEDGDTSWGDEIRGALDTIDSALISFYFGENVAGHSGLDFAYLGGIYRKGNALVSISGSIITLTDDDINYVFINTTTSSVAVNQTGVVLGDIALFEVVTTSGAITTVTDVRSLLSADVTVPHTHNNLLDETAHDLLDHTGLTGVGSSNVADFTDLGDVPSSLIGLGGQAIIVKEDETGLETATLNTTFVDLTDTPVSYIGQSGKIPAVNEDEDGLEFTSVPPSVNGLPQGGTAGQILKKIDGTDYNAQWVDPGGGSAAKVDVLLVGGGGGGGASAGQNCGGGGGGGLIYVQNKLVELGETYAVVVGSGGAGGTAEIGGNGGNGGNSTFIDLLAYGGGGGGATKSPGLSGASGGGGRWGSIGGAGLSGQGYNGGTGLNQSNYGAGGGGGAGEAGNTDGNSQGGDGGSNSINGTATAYGGGGGGGCSGGGTARAGGSGGGGNGGANPNAAQNGTANTGGGGGGGADGVTAGGNGGSGVVIIRYLTADFGDCTGGAMTEDGDYTVHTFTASGDFVTVAP